MQELESKRRRRSGHDEVSGEFVFLRQPGVSSSSAGSPSTLPPWERASCTSTSSNNPIRRHDDNEDVEMDDAGSDTSPNNLAAEPREIQPNVRLSIRPRHFKPAKSKLSFSQAQLRVASSDSPSCGPAQQTDIHNMASSQALNAPIVAKSQKKPGKTALLPRPRRSEAGQAYGVPGPNSIENKDLVAKMEAATLKALSSGYGASAAGSSHETGPASVPTLSKPTQKSRFTPNRNVVRWADRFPEKAAALARDKEERERAEMQVVAMPLFDEMDIDHEDDGEYVIETYKRVPIESLPNRELGAAEAEQFGVVVFDEEDEYAEESTDVEEYDEDDENGKFS